MKEIKLKQRIENAANAFFEVKNPVKNKLSVLHNFKLKKEEASLTVDKPMDLLVKFLKGTFLFLPGAFVLFGLSVALSCLLASDYSLDVGPVLNFRGLTFVFIALLMTIFGLGDLRKPKHLIIPFSIITIGAILGILRGLYDGFRGLDYFIDNVAILFFPLVLIVAYLSKTLVDNFEEEIGG